jgi:deazaflavin-dependent oxidoreductase (nitroreductase family)
MTATASPTSPTDPAPASPVEPGPPAGPMPAEPPLADPPADGALHGLDPIAHRAFKALNRYFMIPMHRAGLGAWLGSPIGGCMLLLRVRGRKSGIVRETPLNYLVADGSVWIVAGFGPQTEWYRNLLADPTVEVVLPTRRLTGTAVEVRSPVVRARILPALLRATGLPSFLAGVNPWTATVAQVTDALDFVPLIRIDPADGWLDPGPDDPGGRAWIWRQALVLVASLVVVRTLRRLLR